MGTGGYRRKTGMYGYRIKVVIWNLYKLQQKNHVFLCYNATVGSS